MTDREREARIRERLRLRVESKPDTYALSHDDALTIIQALWRVERYRGALEGVAALYDGGSGDSQIDLNTAHTIATRALMDRAHRALNDGEDDG